MSASRTGHFSGVDLALSYCNFKQLFYIVLKGRQLKQIFLLKTLKFSQR